MKTLVIYSAATQGYDYALEAQAQKVVANVHALPKGRELAIRVALVSNHEACIAAAVRVYDAAGFKVSKIIDSRFASGKKNYEKDAQLLIAQMRTAACTYARAAKADYVWSLDSDVLPPHNALRCMLDMLEFDAGYYGVAFCPYPSQGGGLFLGGRGVSYDPIFPNSYPDEKEIPKDILKRKKQIEKALKTAKGDEEKSLASELRDIHRLVRDIPAGSNVFSRNAKGWRRRGWFDEAYPAIGKGAVVPVDWTGSGCLLMGREALSLCDWLGYDGGGTEDLYINYHRWADAGLRTCAIPHCVCDHIVRHRTVPGKYVHVKAYHEMHGECQGHLRQRNLAWHPHVAGETHTEGNDGDLSEPAPVIEEGKPIDVDLTPRAEEI